ncbi:hypothetical protein AB1Y20_008093 [Prymnesium parvum]|uniref:UTP--glucose-1-phosphate uridylyltransferase n=1 Tax=Prymnesium parvum TaxID=97485 RepID=A0AB34IVV8_PRYPA
MPARSQPREVFVPGRICLMGEHSDWAGSYRRFNRNIAAGMCLVSGTNQGLYARVSAHPDKLILTSVDHLGRKVGPEEWPMDADVLIDAAQRGGHFSYMCGVAYQMLIRYHVQGLLIDNYKTDLPASKGLSSSAAACVLAARAFNRVYDLKLTVRGEMDLAYLGEISTPSQCGRMDQCCAFGAKPVQMTFDGDRLDCKEFVLNATIYLVIVELAGSKDTTTILQKLNKCYPVAETQEERDLQELLGATNQRLIRSAVEALSAGDMAEVGRLMVEAQALFDKYAMPICPSQLTSPNLHKVLEYAPLQPHIWGAKGVGSQGDGCAQLLCKSEEDVEAVMQIVRRDLGMGCMPLQIGKARPITQALIPAASFSHQLFPASKALPPALFPILDADGFLKPAILLLVEEALDAGLHRVVIVVSPAHKAGFEAIFHKPSDTAVYNSLPPRLQQYADKIYEYGARVTLVVQEEQLGLGHAVLSAQGALKPEPFVLMLGDHLYHSSHPSSTSCTKQLIDAFQGVSIMALKKTAEAELSHFGCATGTWQVLRDAPNNCRLAISSLVEKPTVEYARANLTVAGLHEGEYLTAFGLYIISERAIFDHLKQVEAASAGKVVHLSPALDELRVDHGLQGYLLQGNRYDIGGDPKTYLSTCNALAPSAELQEVS